MEESETKNTIPFPKIYLERTNALDLFTDFMLQNQPCIICASATAKWKSRQRWVKPQVGGKNIINSEFFIKEYGHMKVPVAKGKTKEMENAAQNAKFDEPLCSQACADCQTMELKNYIQKMQMTDGSKDIGYAKDWHFQQESGTSYDMYGLPSFLRFDWINNEPWSNDERNELGDYRFVYFGAKNTWTPFHADVMSSYSWSANICGRKLWYFVPPGNEECFKIDRDTFLEDIRDERHKWPDAGVLSFIQEEGEIVFVPSNWYHQVHNLEDAISINHNFVNASNADLVVDLIARRLVDVDRELADCKACFSTAEYNTYCEQILAADIRVNMAQLSSLLELIINDRRNDVDECWVCPKHRSILDCKRDSNCLELMRTTVRRRCSCQAEIDELCSNCLKFMKSYEISVAIECLARIRFIKESRK